MLVSPWDKLVHIAAYGLLTLALGLVLERCARLGRWSLALAFALAMAVGGVDEALQLLGGYGYLADYGIEKLVRDLRVHRILEGTNEIMRLIVARKMLGAR